VNDVLQVRSQLCLQALSTLQEAFGGRNHPIIMEPIFAEENQLAYVRFSICLPAEWQGDPEWSMGVFDEVWSLRYGHTLPDIVFDYIKA
jgi:hypothetical protein